MHETDVFEAERPRLTAVATRILGGSAEADDVVQEAWLRWSQARADGRDVDEPAAWLTTVVTRLCLDHLRRRTTTERTAEALRESHEEDVVDPEADALLTDRVGEAMDVVIGALRPAERVAFVLHDVFDYPFEDVAVALGRSGAAVRQLASRARRKVSAEAGDDRVLAAERTAHREVVGRFLEAARGGDLATLLTLLAPDVVARADAAGLAMGAQEYVGAEAVAGRFNGARGALPVVVDGYEAAAWIHHRELKVAFLFTVEDGRIREVEQIADPEVLALMEVETGFRGSRDAR